MGLYIDKISGKIFMFDVNSSGTGSTTSSYPEVELYDNLPLPISAATKIYVVRSSS